MKQHFKIQGMSCNGCKANVENTLSKLEGVEEVFADLQASEVHVSSARDYRMEQLQQEMDRAGLHYTLYAPEVELKEPERPEMGAGVYYCPMHCEGDKVYDEFGDCPVCGMDLVAMEQEEGAEQKAYNKLL